MTMPGDPFLPDELLSKEEQLLRVDMSITQLSNKINSNRAKEEEIAQTIKQIQAELARKLADLKTEQERIQIENYRTRRTLRDAEARRLALQKEAEEEKHAKLLAEKYHDLEARLDDIRKNYPWSDAILKHQMDGGNFIVHRKRIILADVMGLGKTLTAISACDLITAATEFATPEELYVTDVLDRFPVDRPCGKKILAMCSSELTYGLWREFKKWAPHRNIIFLTGFPKAVRRVVIDNLRNMSDEYVVIINYEAWRKDLNLLPILGSLDFDTVIIDEAHKLKDRNSVSYRGVASLLSMVPSYFRIFLTGTPILNRPQELFSILSLTDPYRFYDEKQFLLEFCTQKEDNSGRLRWTFKTGGIESLYRKVGPIILRRTKESAGIVLPEKTIIPHDIEIDEDLYPDQARARSEMRKWGSIALDPENTETGYISATEQIAVLTRLRQIETWPAGIELKDPLTKEVTVKLEVHESQKLDYILNPVAPFGLMFDALESNERVVIFSQFTKPLEELAKRCERHGIRAALFIGDTSREEKEEIKTDFDLSQTPTGEHKYDVLLCNYRIGGEGQNFTGASQMIILDEEWNPGKRDQAYDRIHRIGQQRPITIHVVRVLGTVDEWLANLIEFKEELVTGFNNAISSNAAFEALKKGQI